MGVGDGVSSSGGRPARAFTTAAGPASATLKHHDAARHGGPQERSTITSVVPQRPLNSSRLGSCSTRDRKCSLARCVYPIVVAFGNVGRERD